MVISGESPKKNSWRRDNFWQSLQKEFSANPQTDLDRIPRRNSRRKPQARPDSRWNSKTKFPVKYQERIPGGGGIPHKELFPASLEGILRGHPSGFPKEFIIKFPDLTPGEIPIGNFWKKYPVGTVRGIPRGNYLWNFD